MIRTRLYDPACDRIMHDTLAGCVGRLKAESRADYRMGGS